MYISRIICREVHFQLHGFFNTSWTFRRAYRLSLKCIFIDKYINKFYSIEQNAILVSYKSYILVRYDLSDRQLRSHRLHILSIIFDGLQAQGIDFCQFLSTRYKLRIFINRQKGPPPFYSEFILSFTYRIDN